MAITAALRSQTADATDAAFYGIASVTPSANKLSLLAVTSHRATATPTVPTVTGCGLTWVQIATVTYNTLASSDSRLTVFRALGGSPTAGNIVADWSGVTQQCGLLSWVEFDGVDTGGTNGSAAVVQAITSAANAVTSIGAALSPFGDAANNAAWAVATHDGSVSAMTVTANGYTELGTQQTITAPNARIASAWRVGDADPSFLWAASRDVAMIGVEIKAAATGVTGSGAATFAGMTSSGTGTSGGGGGGAAIDQGYDFRLDEGFVTDADGEIWIGAGTANGWSTNSVDASSYSTGVDYRLAGSCWIENTGTQGTLDITLPAPGTYTIRIAAGAHFASGVQFVEIRDTTTPKLTINQPSGYGTEDYYDATNTLRTSAADWVSNNASADITFSTTTLRVVLGTAASNPSTWSAIAHLHIFNAGGGPVTGSGAVTWAGMTSSGSGIGPGGSSGKPAQGATVNAAHALAPMHCWLMDETTGRPHDIGTAALPPPSLDTPTWGTVGGFGTVTQWDGTKHTEYGTGSLLGGLTKFTVVLSAKPDATLGWNQTGGFLSKKLFSASGFCFFCGPSSVGFTSSIFFEIGDLGGTTYGIDYGWETVPTTGSQQQIILAYDASRGNADRVHLYVNGTKITSGISGTNNPVSVEGHAGLAVPSDTTTTIKLGEGAKFSETQAGAEFKGDLGYLYVVPNFFPTAGDVTSLVSNPFPFVRTSPLLTAIASTVITNTTATVTWTTEVPATSRVEFGITDYSQSATDSALVTSHSMPLSGLTPDSVYQFRVKSTAAGQTATSGHFSFQTAQTPAIIGPLLIDKLSTTKVRVSFTSDLPTTAVLDYGTTASYGSQVTDATLRTTHRLSVTGLSASTLYHIRGTVTTAGAVDTLSGDATFTTLASDVTAPSAITALSVIRLAQNGCRLKWTAPGNDAGVGRAAGYIVKRSTSAINSGNFDAATTVTQSIEAAMAGGLEELIVTGLSPSTTYHFAVKAVDAEGNASAISNVPSTTTLAGRATLDVWGGDTRIQSPTGINVGCTFSGTSTGMSATVLTDSGASFPTDGRLVGKLLCADTTYVDTAPNNRQLWYRIASNTATTITIVGGPDGSLTDHAASGDTYMVTGVFRTEKIGDQWWFIDPEGYVFFQRGIVGVMDKFGGGFETAHIYTAIYLHRSTTFTGNLRMQGASWAMNPVDAPGDVIASHGSTCDQVGDTILIGHSRPFAETYFQMSQVGVGGAIRWEYSLGGGTWQILGVGGTTGRPYNTFAYGAQAHHTDQPWSLHISDTGGFDSGSGVSNGLKVTWFQPADYPAPTAWAPMAITGTDGVSRYWIRGVVTTGFSTPPKVSACFDNATQSRLLDLKYNEATISPAEDVQNQFRSWGMTGAGYASSYGDYATQAGLVRHMPIWHHTNVTYNAEPLTKNMYSMVPHAGSPDIGHSIYGVSTGLTATVLTDSSAPFGAVNSQVGRRMVPNTAASNFGFAYSYPIVSNTSTTVTISGGDTASMLDHAAVGNQWKIAIAVGREQVDVWEPSLYDGVTEIINNTTTPAWWWHFRPNPNVLLYVTDEPDFIYGMSWQYERTHMIYCVAASNPYRVENLKHGPVALGDHRFFAKYAFRDFLRYRYRPPGESLAELTRASMVPIYAYTGTANDTAALANLNAAWNTTYTTWDTSSGSITAGTNAWRFDNTTGTGFMDENGIHIVTTFPPLANGSVGAHVSYDNLEANCRTPAIYQDIYDFSALTASKYTYIVYDQLHARSPNLVASFFYGPSQEQAAEINKYADVEWTSTSPLLASGISTGGDSVLPGHVAFRYQNDQKPLYYEVYTMCSQDSPINYGGVVSAVSYNGGTNRTAITWTYGQPLIIRNGVMKFIHIVESDTQHRIMNWVENTLYVENNITASVAVGNTIRVPDVLALAWGYPDWPTPHGPMAEADRDDLVLPVMDARMPDGTYPVAGISKWGYADNPQWLSYETSAWGWVTPQFNAYDGVENVITASKDANGVWHGGEYQAYGDYLSTMKPVMLALEDTLVLRTTVPVSPTFLSVDEASWSSNDLETFTVATAASPPAVLTLDSGTLPAGVALLDNRDGSAVLGGVPTSSGVFNFTLRATNSAGTVTQDFALTIDGAATFEPAWAARSNVLIMAGRIG